MISSFIVGNSLLTAAGFPMCGELDIKTCIAMMIMDRLEIGGSFAEFHPVDSCRDRPRGPRRAAPPEHCRGKAGTPQPQEIPRQAGVGSKRRIQPPHRPDHHVEHRLTAGGRFKFVIAEGESLRGPIPPTGNTNTHAWFGTDVRAFLKRWVAEGPTHHFALGLGHHGQTLAQLAGLLGIEYAVVTRRRNHRRDDTMRRKLAAIEYRCAVESGWPGSRPRSRFS